MQVNKISLLIFIVLAPVAALFYLNFSKTVDLKESSKSYNFADKASEDTTGKIQAESALNSLKTVVAEYEALRIPEESFTDEYEIIEQFFINKEYSETLSQAQALEVTARSAIDAEKQKPQISITFDAGAGVGATQKLVDYLASSRLKITFFSTGKWAEQNPELFKGILTAQSFNEKGLSSTDNLVNELGNHTYSHPHFVSDGLTDEQIAEQVNKAENIFNSLGYMAKPLRQAQGKPLFRYPYGERNTHIENFINDLGYKSIYWTVDSLGWQNKLSGEEIAQRVIDKIGPNGIVLMHVGSAQDVGAVPLIVDRLKNDYRFVFASEL